MPGSPLRKATGPDQADSLARLDVITCELDPVTLRFTAVSGDAARLLGHPVSDWLLPGFLDLNLLPADRAATEAALRRARDSAGLEEVAFSMLALDGRTVPIRARFGARRAGTRVTELTGLLLVGGAPVTAAAAADDDPDRQTHLRFFQSMDRVNRAIQAATDLDQMLSDVLDVLLHILQCDRAWLLYPCDPDAEEWSVPMERTRSEYPGAFAMGEPLPNSPEAIEVFRLQLATDEPIAYGPGTPYPIPEGPRVQFQIQSMLAMAIHPKVGKPYLVGLHQCRGPRTWSSDDARLFQEVGRRLADALSTLLVHRERQQAEERFRRNHSLLSAVIEGTSDAIFVKALDGRYLMANQNAAINLGRSPAEVLGHTDQELLPPEIASEIVSQDAEVAATGIPRTFEVMIPRAGVTHIFLSTKNVLRTPTGEITGIVGIARDITELKRLEGQFRQAQKMEAIGQLAGGIAHDFNNLLTVIQSYTSMVYMDLAEDDPNRECLAEVLQAGQRTARLTRQLLTFSRQQVLNARVLSLNTVLQQLDRLLRPLIGEDIELRLDLAPDLGTTRVDAAEFEQAMLNLALNARDAMPDGGRLTLSTRNLELGPDQGAAHPGVPPGRYVVVTAADTGVGMSEDTVAHIFDPFFTTKQPGQGTGLGLAMVYGFVQQSGGYVEVESAVGRGTTLRILLPASTEPLDAAPAAAGAAPSAGGSETILLVEDEDAIRALCQRTLEARGYRVLVAGRGAEALGVAESYEGTIHLLLTDMVMPGMSGRDLADHLTGRRHGLRVLFMSGYPNERRRGSSAGASDGRGMLQKPFTPDGLTARVREVLDHQLEGTAGNQR